MKYVIAALLAVCLVGAVYAVPPPANDGYLGGWGMNPTNWQTTTGSFSAWGIYDPLGGGGGAPWVVSYGSGGTPVYINYAPITVELWVEMYAIQAYRYTSYQYHRLGNAAETVCFTIEGTLQSNNGQYVQLMKGADPLNKLYFRHNVLGGLTPGASADLPITWAGTWGTGLVYGQNIAWGPLPLTPNPDLTMLIADPCDHWFQFQGCFAIPYHQADGYYSLTMAGCPAPEL